MTIRRLEILALTAIVVVLVLLFALETGGRGYFSPDTLETKWHSLHGYVGLSVEGSAHVYRHKLTEYLVAKGHWKASEKGEPRWLLLFDWHTGQRDGETQLERQLFWNDDEWIAWSEQHPKRAAVLWPRVLEILREDGDQAQSALAEMLYFVEHAKNDAEFNAALMGNTDQH